MKTIEYHEVVLKKVIFDDNLLKKELEKAFRKAACSEYPALLGWCAKELGPKYARIAALHMQDKDCVF